MLRFLTEIIIVNGKSQEVLSYSAVRPNRIPLFIVVLFHHVCEIRTVARTSDNSF